jgi:hypothetical protein
MEQLYNYSPAANVLTIGRSRVEGFGPDDALSIEPGDDSSTTQVGLDGQVTRTVITNPTGIATVSLMQTSRANRVLEALLALQNDGANGSDVAAFYYKDAASGEEHTAEQCFIERRPDYTFGKEAGVREWRIRLVTWRVSYAEAVA